MRINWITNPDKLIQEKVCYFVDTFQYFVLNAGAEANFELESPTALMQRILFRLVDDNELRLTYFDDYFSSNLFNFHWLWNSYSSYELVKQALSQYRDVEKNTVDNKINAAKRLILADPQLKQNIAILIAELETKLADDLVEGLLQVVSCTHSLDFCPPNETMSHAQGIKVCASILASEYFYRGFTVAEILAIVRNVFSRDIKEFPFPEGIESAEKRKEYLDKRDLKMQMSGFKNAFNVKRSETQIFIKVYGGVFPDKFEFQYDQVKFFGQQHSVVNNIRETLDEVGKASFFVEGDYIVAVTRVIRTTESSLLSKLKRSIQQALKFFSATLDREFTLDNSGNFIEVDKSLNFKRRFWSTQKFHHPFTDFDLSSLRDNAYEALNTLSSPAIEWFLKFETVFLNAHSNKSISDYWLYLETLLPHFKDKKELMGLVSSIVLLNEKQLREERITNTLAEIFGPFGGGIDLLKLSSEKHREIQRVLGERQIPPEVRENEYPFFKDRVVEFDASVRPECYRFAKEYYFSIFKESYGYRNFFVHKGVINAEAHLKLTVTLPLIVIRLRWAIFEGLKKGGAKLTFSQLIDDLANQAANLLATDPIFRT